MLVVSAPELSVGVARARRGRRRLLSCACRVSPGIIRWVQEEAGRDWLRRPRYYLSGAALNTTAFVASAPELSVRGEGARWMCLVARARVGRVWLRRKERDARDWLRWPRNYPSGEQERVRRCLSLCPRNYPLGARERVGRVWLRWPRNYPSGAKECIGRGWLRRPRDYPSGDGCCWIINYNC